MKVPLFLKRVYFAFLYMRGGFPLLLKKQSEIIRKGMLKKGYRDEEAESAVLAFLLADIGFHISTVLQHAGVLKKEDAEQLSFKAIDLIEKEIIKDKAMKHVVKYMITEVPFYYT